MTYVLEGSRLGGAVLLRRVLANPDGSCRAATAFLRHGAGGALWPSFVAALEGERYVAGLLKAATAGAEAAFAAFERAARLSVEAEVDCAEPA